MIIFYLFMLSFSIIVCIGFIIFAIFQILAMFTTDAPFVPIPKETEDKIIEIENNTETFKTVAKSANVRSPSIKNPIE